MKLTNKEVLTNTTTIIGYADEVLNIKDPIELLAVFKCAASTIDSIINVKMQEDLIKSVKERSIIGNNPLIKYRNGGN